MSKQTQGDGLPQWNLGGWLGGLLGGTLWMFLAAVGIFLKAPSPVYGLLICLVASTVLVLGWFLWQNRGSLDQFSAMLIIIAVLYPATMSTFAFMQLAGIDDYRIDEWWSYITGVFLVIAVQFIFLRRQKPRKPAGSPKTIRTFDPSDLPLTQKGVTRFDDGWRIESEEKRIVCLFEVSVSGIEQCMVTYRAMLKTVDVNKRVYLEMWLRLPGRGEFFSKGFHNAIKGTNDWASYEIPFHLKKGERPDLFKLNIVFDGPGTVFMKDIELLQTRLK